MRVIVLAAVVILVGCGTDERDRPEPPAASTRAAGTDFLQRCARGARGSCGRLRPIAFVGPAAHQDHHSRENDYAHAANLRRRRERAAAALDGDIDVDAFLSHRITLDEVNEGFDLMHDQDGIRSVIEFG